MLCARHPVESRLLARQALGLAGARDRMFLQMYFIQGWSQKDIAAQLQAPENTVASCLARARLRVQKIVVTPVPPRASK
jgi:DNA-directed RNA polymerase specialized sigma24 family protein